MIYADVIVDISVESIDKTFQYGIPEDLQHAVNVGTRVLIPFGNRREMTGYVVGLSLIPKIEPEKIKLILGVAEKSISIEGKMITLAAWIKENYGGTMNDSLKTVLPVKREVRIPVKKEIKLVVSETDAKNYLIECEKKHFAAQARLLNELIKYNTLSCDLVSEKLNISPASLNALQKKGMVEVRACDNVYLNPGGGAEQVTLNDEQEEAKNKIIGDIKAGKANTYLLHGITGSGKTEVYMEVISYVVSLGKKVIVLIPEISLTFQTVLRFTKRFGNKVAFFNSRLSAGEKYDRLMKAKNGEIDIMIGPRSALFTPFNNIGLIVIDEEHSGTYKSENVPKYHAREVAKKICEMNNAPLILGSATPSVESYKKATDNEYVLLNLKKRAKNASVPEVKIVDLREELKNNNRSMFSVELVNDISERLYKHEQIILFLNRRGYSGFVSCRKCGEVIMCPHCAVSLNLHYGNILKCHYCGYETRFTHICPSCGSKYIKSFGTGTEKVEELTKKLFPTARVLRMDADTTRTKEAHEKILSSFADGEADILVGTQMIVKGHDFPRVTLVGILAADLSLYAEDYRSAERTYELLAQAAGRAGRDSLPGKVIIQTYRPDHYAVTCAANNDYAGFFKTESAFRKLMLYPPYAHLMAVLFVSKDEKKSQNASIMFADAVVKKYSDLIKAHELMKIGPSAAGISKINDFYRNTVYFKSEKYDILCKICADLENMREKFKSEGISFQTDFDPVGGY